MDGQPRRILVIQLKRIGDLLLTTPALEALREEFPASEIVLLTGASCAELLPILPATRALPLGSPGFWKAAIDGADLCLDFTGTDRSAAISALSRARCRATFARFKKKFPHRLAYTQFVESSVRDRHTVDHLMDLLSVVGITRDTPALRLDIPSEVTREAAKLVPDRPYAVIHAGTARPEKYWVASRWAEVAGTLASTYDLEIVLTGSTDPAETSHVSDIIQALDSGVSARNLCGKTRLPALAAVIAGAKVFCGVDTAAMHMAEAVRTPCLALFGPTNPYHWRPRVTKNAVLRSRTAAPFGPAQKGGRMEELPAPRVIEALHGLLNSQL